MAWIFDFNSTKSCLGYIKRLRTSALLLHGHGVVEVLNNAHFLRKYPKEIVEEPHSYFDGSLNSPVRCFVRVVLCWRNMSLVRKERVAFNCITNI